MKKEAKDDETPVMGGGLECLTAHAIALRGGTDTVPIYRPIAKIDLKGRTFEEHFHYQWRPGMPRREYYDENRSCAGEGEL